VVGIREIEFIAQALQLAHGARDEWLRVSHTLNKPGARLADRNLISEQERSELSEPTHSGATLEHRLHDGTWTANTHGAATTAQRIVVARRMGASRRCRP